MIRKVSTRKRRCNASEKIVKKSKYCNINKDGNADTVYDESKWIENSFTHNYWTVKDSAPQSNQSNAVASTEKNCVANNNATAELFAELLEDVCVPRTPTPVKKKCVPKRLRKNEDEITVPHMSSTPKGKIIVSTCVCHEVCQLSMMLLEPFNDLYDRFCNEVMFSIF